MKLWAFLFLLASFSGCSSLFYQPDSILYYPPEKFGFEKRQMTFTTQDGLRLVGWWFPVKSGKPKGTVVQFHGNAENMSSHYTSLIWLTREGYQLFSFDYRGYGASDGEPSQRGTYLDGMAALSEAWKKHTESGAESRFVVYGQSLGGAIAARCLANFSQKEEVSLLVMDSSYSSYPKVAQSALAQHWFTWPISPLGRVLVSNEYGAEEAIKSLKNRLLVIHDKKDPAVSYENGEKVFQISNAPKDLWILNEGAHIAVFNDPVKGYRKKFVGLLGSLK